MNEYDPQTRIQQLQHHRHALLRERDSRGACIGTIEMELNVVRSELLALYESRRPCSPHHAPRTTPPPRAAAARCA